MKKLYSLFIGLILVLFTVPIIAQTVSSEIIIADTISNSQTKTYTLDVDQTCDSMRVSLFSQGEIDLDSLAVDFGYSISRVPYLSTHSALKLSGFEATSSTTYSQTLTVNLDTAVTSYSNNVVTIPKTALGGYNKVKLSVIAASSGNDATDPGQKVVIWVTTFKP